MNCNLVWSASASLTTEEVVDNENSSGILNSQRHPSHPNSLFAIGLAALYFCVAGFSVYHHEMWRDELQAWMTVKDAVSWQDLSLQLRYGGHPFLWYALLYPLTLLTENPVAMQGLHLVIATSMIYIFARYSPFSPLQKTLFSFSYFPLFEYGVISRNYSLGVLLIFAFCAALPLRRKSYLPIAGILALLMQVNTLAVLFAVGAIVMLLVEYSSVAALRRSTSMRDVVLALCTLFAAFLLTLWQIIPPRNSSNSGAWDFAWNGSKFMDVMEIIWRSWVPVPRLNHHFWNTNIIDTWMPEIDMLWLLAISGVFLLAFYRKPVVIAIYSFITISVSVINSWFGAPTPIGFGALLACFALIVIVCSFLRKPLVLLLFCFVATGLLAFAYGKFYGFLRHHGHFFILLIVCLWLAAHFKETRLRIGFAEGLAARYDRFLGRYQSRIITILLALHCLVGLSVSIYDWYNPFSASKEAAVFISKSFSPNITIIGDDEYTTSAVAGYLGHEIYYAASRRFGTFVIFDDRTKLAGPQAVLSEAQRLSEEQQQDVLLLLQYPLKPNVIETHPVRLFATFQDSIERSEHYYLYVRKYHGTAS